MENSYMEVTQMPEHEKIFNEICSKLNELSQVEENKSSKDRVTQLEKMHNQIKNFQFDLMATHEDMQLKIHTLEHMTTSNSDLTTRVQELTELLNQERSHNSKLSTDLAKSLDLSLKLQLEIQEIKTRALQAQLEDRKIHQDNFESMKYKTYQEKTELLKANEELLNELKSKEAQIELLNQKTNDLEAGMGELDKTTVEQGETIKHLMSVAENKIVELKLALDRSQNDFTNASGELTQVKTQVELFKQENYSLKDYINKMTVYQKQMLAQQAQAYGTTPTGASPS
jgi:chromosome segregation ATPase